MTIAPVNIVHLLFAFISLYGAALLCNQRRYTALVYLLIASGLLSIFNFTEETNLTRSIHLVTPSFSLVFGPLYYLFVRHLIDKEQPVSKKDFLHLLPAIFSLPFTMWVQWVLLLGTISELIYGFWCIKILRQYRRASFEQRSDAMSIQLSWITQTLALYILLSLIDLPRLNLQTVLPYTTRSLWYLGTQIAYFSLFCYLIFKAVRQPNLFVALELKPLAEHQSSQDRQQAISLFKQINAQIREQHLYRQPRLSLQNLSKITGLNEKDLSWAINKGSGKNFCDYINGIRIEEIKIQLTAGVPEGGKILDIALSAGFNSKSSFNAVFKKEVGMNPSQFTRPKS